MQAHSPRDEARSLLGARAVRVRCASLLERAEANALDGFTVDREALGRVADRVVTVTLERYPDLDIPFHSRWRHFEIGGTDRFTALTAHLDAEERLRAAFDLVVVSVLLDAGAGATWRYRESAGGMVAGRSEGLALASLDLFAAGAFSSNPDQPLRADARGLLDLSSGTLAAGLQVADDNPLVGLEGRLVLLNRLGAAVATNPDTFGSNPPRVAGLAGKIIAGAAHGTVRAPAILDAVLDALGPIWPGRLSIHGIDLGDTWRHPAVETGDATRGLVPFHKLSQWLSYSLVEPLVAAGTPVTDLDGLTGLAEYRNGGLLVDLQALRPRDPEVLGRTHAIDSTLVVEWRALTVALLDVLAPMVRERLGVDAQTLPLARMLEGGTWVAGRRAAEERRPDASPPIGVASDGTVF